MLKRLELIGFKSFAAKTVLEFPGGISAIVGPNGSGKSNIIDALRWLLGERDAKNLRGGKSEDLIFAGTPARPRVGLAQASIYFDNTSSFFPVEFSEVAVMREVNRSGDSKCFLNKAEVRLRDLVDFFARVRLGAKGLVVIGQGASDLFIAATPEERRAMIEEILGLREYQLKKLEAERKHKNTILNLEKVTALVDEITPHLRLLRRQTSRWEKRAELDAELKNLERSFFGLRLAEVSANFFKIDPQVRTFDARIAAASKELSGLEARVREIEKAEPTKHGEIKKIKGDESALSAKKSTLLKELGRLEARLEFSVVREENAAISVDVKRAVTLLKNLRFELERFSSLNAEEMQRAAARFAKQIEELFAVKGEASDIAGLEDEKKRLVSALESLNGEIEALRAREAAISESLESQSAEFRQAVAAAQAKKNEVYGLEGEKNKLLFERERWNLREEDLRVQVTRAGLNYEEFRVEVAVMPLLGEPASPEFQRGEPQELERKILRLRGDLASIGDIDEAALREAKETEERHAFLTAQSADLEKAIKDLEGLKSDLEQKINVEFESALRKINQEFSHLFELMFGGGRAKLKIKEPRVKKEKETKEEADPSESVEALAEEAEEEEPEEMGIDMEVSIPRKRITGLDMLSGGERSLVSIAALFALVSVSPPPFLVLDEIDAALDERNARRFAEMLKSFSKKTQFVIVTHNRATMEVADVLYGVTMGEDGTSRVLSLKLEDKAPQATGA